MSLEAAKVQRNAAASAAAVDLAIAFERPRLGEMRFGLELPPRVVNDDFAARPLHPASGAGHQAVVCVIPRCCWRWARPWLRRWLWRMPTWWRGWRWRWWWWWELCRDGPSAICGWYRRGWGGAWTEAAAEHVAWARATSARAVEAGAAGPMLAAGGGQCGAAQAGLAEGLALRRERMEWGGEGVWGPTEQRSGDGVAGELASCRRSCKRTSGRLQAGISWESEGKGGGGG